MTVETLLSPLSTILSFAEEAKIGNWIRTILNRQRKIFAVCKSAVGDLLGDRELEDSGEGDLLDRPTHELPSCNVEDMVSNGDSDFERDFDLCRFCFGGHVFLCAVANFLGENLLLFVLGVDSIYRLGGVGKTRKHNYQDLCLKENTGVTAW